MQSAVQLSVAHEKIVCSQPACTSVTPTENCCLRLSYNFETCCMASGAVAKAVSTVMVICGMTCVPNVTCCRSGVDPAFSRAIVQRLLDLVSGGQVAAAGTHSQAAPASDEFANTGRTVGGKVGHTSAAAESAQYHWLASREGKACRCARLEACLLIALLQSCQTIHGA